MRICQGETAEMFQPLILTEVRLYSKNCIKKKREKNVIKKNILRHMLKILLCFSLPRYTFLDTFLCREYETT